MGDDGKLYNGITEDTVTHMRELISVADYIIPNYTEAAYLANVAYKEEGTSEEELHAIIDLLREMGAKSVVITSAKVKGSNSKSVVGYDQREKSFFRIDFNEIAVRFPGTGDIFSAVFIGKIMDGKRENLSYGNACCISIYRYFEIWRRNTKSGKRNCSICLSRCGYTKYF